MNDFDREIDEALASENTIPKEKVVAWIESSTRIGTLSKLYRLTRDRYYQITPELGDTITCGLIQRYLLQCIEEDIVDKNENRADRDKIEGRWEAAQSLHIWFCHLLETGSSDELLTLAARSVNTNLPLGNQKSSRGNRNGFP